MKQSVVAQALEPELLARVAVERIAPLPLGKRAEKSRLKDQQRCHSGEQPGSCFRDGNCGGQMQRRSRHQVAQDDDT